MSTILKPATALAIAVASAVLAPAPASAAVSTVPVRVVPGVTKIVEACDPGGFTVTTAPKRGTVVAGDMGFVCTTNSGVTSGQDSLVGHCDSDAATTPSFRITLAGRNPIPVGISFAESCKGSRGTVVFTVVNNDIRRRSVQISSPGLSPRQSGGFVPAASTQSTAFGIGASAVRAAVRINGGSPSFVDLKGCPGGDGAEGVVPGQGSRTGGGFLAAHHSILTRR
jgi:hypothetical protein